MATEWTCSLLSRVPVLFGMRDRSSASGGGSSASVALRCPASVAAKAALFRPDPARPGRSSRCLAPENSSSRRIGSEKKETRICVCSAPIGSELKQASYGNRDSQTGLTTLAETVDRQGIYPPKGLPARR